MVLLRAAKRMVVRMTDGVSSDSSVGKKSEERRPARCGRRGSLSLRERAS
jgi:hypothetical protein